MNKTRRKQRTATPVVEPFWREESRAVHAAWEVLTTNRMLLLVMLGFALFSRFFGITHASPWMDEVVILEEAFSGKYRTVSFSAHAAHLIPVSFFLRIFGQGELALRVWGALLGSLAVPLTMIVARHIASRAVMIFAGVFMLANQFLIFYAQDGNYYGGMTFYTALQLLAMAWVARGIPHFGWLLWILASAISFKNHPISIIPTALSGAMMATFCLINSPTRNALFSISWRSWIRRPALPLLGVMVAGAMLVAGPRVPTLWKSFNDAFSPGASTLTNVEYGFPLFREHFASLMLNFYRHEGAWMDVAAMLPLILILFALIGILLDRRLLKNQTIILFYSFSILIPCFSYFVLFGLKANRNFNLRYFIFLVPPMTLLMALAAGGIAVQQLRIRRVRSLLITAFLLATPSVYFSLRYLASTHPGYRQALAEVKPHLTPTSRVILATRNDRIESRYFFKQANLPYTAPEVTFFNQPAYADLLGGGFPVWMQGSRDTTIISGWRWVDAPTLWAHLQSGPPNSFRLTRSKLGPTHDTIVRAWRDEDFLNRIPVAGNGPATAINFPDQARQSLVHIDGEDFIKSERDASFDYLLRSSGSDQEFLNLTLVGWAPGDKITAQNNPPLMEELWLSIAINGRHDRLYQFPLGADRRVPVSIPLDLSKGIHRVTLTGFQPRLPYTPYFVWMISKSPRWEDTPTAPPPAIIEGVAPGWPSIPSPDSTLWSTAGPYEMSIDETLSAPAGDRPFRIQFPKNSTQPFRLLTPPIPVAGHTLASYSFYWKLSGMEEQEATPLAIFLAADGAQVGSSLFANGPNFRGTTYGKGWVRRVVTVPVPAGAVTLIGGIQTALIANAETSGGTMWLGSFATPGCKVVFDDPALPKTFFEANP